MKRDYAISAGLHATLLLGILLLGFVSPQADRPKKTITVRLGSAAPPQAAPRQPAPEAPASPPKPEPPPPPPPPPEPPKPPKEVATKSRPAPAKKKLSDKKIMDGTPTPTPEPTPRVVAQATKKAEKTPKETPKETPQPAATPYRPPETPKPQPKAVEKPKATPYRPPDRSAGPTFTTAGPTGGPAATTRDLAIDNTWDLDAAYASRALFLIQQNFRSPYSRPGVSCRVQFKIMRNGEIRDPKLVRSSGSGDLDRSAFIALEATGTLAPLYADYTEPFMLVEVTFDFEQSG